VRQLSQGLLKNAVICSHPCPMSKEFEVDGSGRIAKRVNRFIYLQV